MTTLKEAVMKDPELGEAVWNEYIAKATRNPVYKKLLKEGLYSDIAGALGAVQDAVWAAAYPNMVSREIIKVIPTKNALERFPKEIRAYAWEGEGPAKGTGGRVETQDVKANIEITSKKEWTESFVEDASWDVLRWQIESIGKAIARYETEKVIAAYKANEGGDAGSVDVGANAVTWANICDVVGLVEAQDFHPNVFVLHPKLFQDLMKLDQFVNSLYRPTESMRKGMVYHTTLDINFISSSLCTFTSGGANATYGYCIDTNAAGVLLVRRDLTTKPYEDPGRNMHGVIGTARIGVGILRPTAVARLRGTRT
jgi:HK97 family phage major capsid protein